MTPARPLWRGLCDPVVKPDVCHPLRRFTFRLVLLSFFLANAIFRFAVLENRRGPRGNAVSFTDNNSNAIPPATGSASVRRTVTRIPNDRVSPVSEPINVFAFGS